MVVQQLIKMFDLISIGVTLVRLAILAKVVLLQQLPSFFEVATVHLKVLLLFKLVVRHFM